MSLMDLTSSHSQINGHYSDYVLGKVAEALKNVNVGHED